MMLGLLVAPNPNAVAVLGIIAAVLFFVAALAAGTGRAVFVLPSLAFGLTALALAFVFLI